VIRGRPDADQEALRRRPPPRPAGVQPARARPRPPP
jgi:hypothetical protein